MKNGKQVRIDWFEAPASDQQTAGFCRDKSKKYILINYTIRFGLIGTPKKYGIEAGKPLPADISFILEQIIREKGFSGLALDLREQQGAYFEVHGEPKIVREGFEE